MYYDIRETFKITKNVLQEQNKLKYFNFVTLSVVKN